MKYYLLPGNKIGAPGLPGGSIEAKTKPREISKEEIACFAPSLEYLMSQGKIVTELPETEDPKEEEDEETGDNTVGKSQKRLDLEAQANELGIEFEETISNTKLSNLIKKGLS